MPITKYVEEIRDRLIEREQQIAVAESLTGGRVQALLTAVSGASSIFAGGVTAYLLDQKVQLLGVDRDLAAACNCVSETVAEQMAIGACNLFQVPLAIATTGYAESEAGIDVPFTYVSVCKLNGVGTKLTERFEFNPPQGGRTAAQDFFAEAAIKMLHRMVVETTSD